MGKRKSSSKPGPKRRADPLATTFKCVFCHHERSVTVKMDKQEMYGHLTCKDCGQKYSSPINNLSAAVDVYCDWKDACEELRERQPSPVRPPRPANPITHGAGGGAAYSAGGRTTERDADGADDSEDEDEERQESRSSKNKTTNGKGDGRKSAAYGDDSEEEEEEEDVGSKDSGKDKRRRVEVESDEDDD